MSYFTVHEHHPALLICALLMCGLIAAATSPVAIALDLDSPVPAEVRVDGPSFVGSGITPYRQGCGLSRTDGSNLPNTETDPRLAVERAGSTRARIHLAFMQDPVVGIRAGYSDDMGATWHLTDPPGLSVCTGGHGNTFGDQDIAAGPRGLVGLISITGTLVTAGSRSHAEQYAFDGTVQFNRSTDSGTTWLAPVTISSGGVYQHTAMTAVDIEGPDTIYAAWATIPNPPGMLPKPPHLAEGFVYFSRSTDGGATWSAPLAITAGYQLWDLKVGDGGAVIAFVDGDQLVRSNDRGAHWAKPTQLPVSISNSALYKFSNGQVMAGDLPLAIGPKREIYYVASVERAGRGTALQFLKSTDQGSTWSDPVIIRVNSIGLFHATVAADTEGRLVAMWYDLQTEPPGSGKLTTVVRVASSLDGGRTWAGRAISKAFDMNRAPTLFGAQYLGNYQGLIAVRPGQFVGVYAVAPPVSRRGKADLQSFRLVLPEKVGHN